MIDPALHRRLICAWNKLERLGAGGAMNLSGTVHVRSSSNTGKPESRAPTPQNELLHDFECRLSALLDECDAVLEDQPA